MKKAPTKALRRILATVVTVMYLLSNLIAVSAAPPKASAPPVKTTVTVANNFGLSDSVIVNNLSEDDMVFVYNETEFLRDADVPHDRTYCKVNLYSGLLSPSGGNIYVTVKKANKLESTPTAVAYLPEILSVSATNGTLKINFAAKPAKAPVAANFTATHEIDGGEAAPLALSGFKYDGKMSVTYTFKPVAKTAVPRNVLVTVKAGGSLIDAPAFTVGTNSSNDITAFSIGTAKGIIKGTDIAVTMPIGTDLTALKAVFTASPFAAVKVGDTAQVSGTTVNDFTDPVSYTVTAQDGTEKTYTVTVTAGSAAKDITSFGIGTVKGVINGNDITVILPSTVTNLTALKPVFALSPGAAATVYGVKQVSGTTANNFTNPVSYTIKAQNGSTKTYNVTVSNKSPANDITSFSIGTVKGIISGTNITVTMPYGTNLDGLKATFTASAFAKVKVGAEVQVSGTTANNFAAGPVYYDVVAQDTSKIKTYTVTVIEAPASAANDITVFSIGTVKGIINGTNITVTMPVGTNLTALKPVFTASPLASVKVGEAVQVSGTTVNNFTDPVDYIVKSQDGAEKIYTVTVTAGSAAKNFTSFKIGTGVATIDGDTVEVIVPAGTSLTALKAVFTVSPYATVKVGDIAQVSGTTVNNFTLPVVYTVKAQNGSTKNYTVTVTPADADEETMFRSFSIGDSVGVIDQVYGYIDVTVPYGTNLTALKPTFKVSPFATVKVGTLKQVSGTTANNFTYPIEYVITAQGVQESRTYEVSVESYSASELRAVSAINFAAAAEMGTVIETVYNRLDLDITDYIILEDVSPVHLAMVDGKPYSNPATVQVVFTEAVAAQKAAEAAAAEAVAAVNAASAGLMDMVLDDNSATLGLNFLDYMSLTNNTPVLTAMVDGKPYSNAAAVKTAFNEAVAAQKAVEAVIKAIAAINGTTVDGMGAALRTNAAVLGLNLTDYNALTDKVPVHEAMADGGPYVNDAAVKAAFNAAVDAEMGAEVTSTETKAVDAINAANAAGMGLAITTYAVPLGLDLKDYSALKNKTTVYTALIGKSFENATAVKNAFNEAVAAQKTKEAEAAAVAAVNAATAAGMSSVIGNNAEILALDLTDYNALTNKAPVHNKLVSPAFINAAAVRAAFIAAVTAQMAAEEAARAAINGADASGMGAVITANAVNLGLSLTNYNVLKNKTPVHEAMAGKSFEDNAAVKTAFDAAVADQKEMEAIATITSEIYTVNKTTASAGTITKVPAGTTKAVFLAALTKDYPGQSWNATGITATVATGNKLIVTAQNGITKVTYTVTVDTANMNLTLTAPIGEGNSIEVGGATRTGEVLLINGTTSVRITGTKTLAQRVTKGGTDAAAVAVGGTATHPTYTVDTTDIAVLGGSKTFTLTVSETGKGSIVYTITVVVAPSDTVNKIVLTASITAEIGAVHESPVYVLNEADYTGESWAAYTAAIAAAIAVEGNEDATQDAVDAAAANIATAKTALVFVNKSVLDASKAEAASKVQAYYTDASWTEYTAALAAALEMPETTNSEIIQKTTAIHDAMSVLVLNDTGKVALVKAAIAAADFTNLSVLDTSSTEQKLAAVQAVVDGLKGETTALVSEAGAYFSVAISLNAANDTVSITTATFVQVEAPSSDASLAVVLGQAITAGGQAGTIGEPKLASINVDSISERLDAWNMAATNGLATVTFYGIDSTFMLPELGSVNLPAGGATVVYIKVVAQDAATTLYYAVTINREALSSDAGLAQVLVQAITAGGQAGTIVEPKLASINVSSIEAGVAAGDIYATDAGATVMFYGTDNTFMAPELGSVSLALGGATVVYIKVTAADATTLYYAVTINRAAITSSDATLAQVLNKIISTESGSGESSGDPKLASISVDGAVAVVAAGDIMANDAGATVTFYGIDSGFATEEAGNVNLAAGVPTVVYIKVEAEDTTTRYYALTITRTASNDAGLAAVLGHDFIAGYGAGTTAEPLFSSISVAYSVAEVTADDITAADAGATVTFYGADFSFLSEETGIISLTEGVETVVYIGVTAEDAATTLYYAVGINRAATASSNASLATVLGGAITQGGQPGTMDDPILAFTSVAYDVADIAANDIVAYDAGATVTFYGTDFSFTAPDAGSVSLTAGEETVVYIRVEAEDATTLYYALGITRPASASSDASLATVKGQAITDGGQAGTIAEPKQVSIDVASFVAIVSSMDIMPNDTGATVTFYGIDSTFTNPETGSVDLTAGGATVVYIEVVAEDATTLYYELTINRAAL